MTIGHAGVDGDADGVPSNGNRPKKVRRRSASVTLGVTAIVATTLFGCGGPDEQYSEQQYSGDDDYDYGAVCVDEDTQVRVDDDQCDDDYDGGAGFAWYYLPVGSRGIPVGRAVRGGTFTPPSGEQAFRGGVPRDGGVVSRGGFGGESGSFGG